MKKRVSSACDSCKDKPGGKACVAACSTGAILTTQGEYFKHDCVHCYDCEKSCPTDAITVHSVFNFKSVFPKESRKLDQTKRNFLFHTAAASLLFVPFLRQQVSAVNRDKATLRPPLVMEPESDFNAACIRCDRCINVCPTGVLQPAGFEHGFLNLSTPIMDFKKGFCKVECSACSSACPTSAITAFKPKMKKKFKMGTAVILKDTCIAWTEDKHCRECIRLCPLTAIIGDPAAPYRPISVDYSLCNGCGICDHICRDIVYGDIPGIIMTSAGRGQPTRL